MKQTNGPVDTVERPLTVRPALSRAAVQFVEKYPNELTGIVADALEAAAIEEGRVASKAVALPEGLRRLIVPRRADSTEGRVSSISEAAELLEITRATVYAWIKSERLLAWRATRRGVLIPTEQIIRPGEVIPGIAQVLAVIGEPEAAWDFLNEESAFLDPKKWVRPIDALREGKVDEVVAAAHSFLEAFS